MTGHSFATGDHVHGFTVQRIEDINEINGSAIIMRHDQSQARLMLLHNDDPNKAFSIAFRTPPKDDTGVFHILEHSVLCGSDKFPVKEPFVNLLKTSMQTFLNAMTFPDKTMYPVASTNEQDLMNLADVYMDAVLHPAIYTKPEIFQQEGWHYEIEGEGDERKLVYNGVVFNEMKGALSSPDDALYDAIQSAMFPDTSYGFESGGTPAAIPTLTYEEYLNEHRRHYQLSNAYIILYGDLNAENMLQWLDENYLSCAEVPSAEFTPRELSMQAPVEQLGLRKDMITAPENACCAFAVATGDIHDRERLIATDILLDALTGSNEAPLKRALLDANIAADAGAYLADGVLQPLAVVQLRGSQPDSVGKLQEIVESCIGELVEQGINQDLIEAALSHAEFVMREHDFGIADGVALAMSAMSGWLYDDELATTYLYYEDVFRSLRDKLRTGYYEQLARELFLDNPHRASVEIVPVEAPEITDEERKLADIATNMTDVDWQMIADEVVNLRAMQEGEDDPEALASLPQLTVDDLGEMPERPDWSYCEDSAVPCIHHDAQTNGITYAYRYFSLDCVDFDELPYTAVLCMVLGKLDTAQHTAAELDILSQSNLGTLSFFSEVHVNDADMHDIHPLMVAGASALDSRIDEIAALPREIILETQFANKDKVRDILQQKRVALEHSMANNGHTAALARTFSYYSKAGVVSDLLGGIGFYRFLRDLTDHYEERADDLMARLADLAQRIFTDDNETLGFTGSQEAYEQYAAASRLGRTSEEDQVRLVVPEPVMKREAFIMPTDVAFVCLSTNQSLIEDCPPFSGAWGVASRAVNFDYLWNEVRVKGGAYGVGFQTARNGRMRFYSYRDPHVNDTLQRYADSAEWLRNYQPSDEELEGYIVSSVAALDRPIKTRELVRQQDGAHFAKRDRGIRRKARNEMIAATLDDFKRVADAIDGALAIGGVCVFGNKDVIAEVGDDFCVIDLMNESTEALETDE